MFRLPNLCAIFSYHTHEIGNQTNQTCKNTVLKLRLYFILLYLSNSWRLCLIAACEVLASSVFIVIGNRSLRPRTEGRRFRSRRPLEEPSKTEGLEILGTGGSRIDGRPTRLETAQKMSVRKRISVPCCLFE